jgi:3'(2'), 5'-bisphosphate nucleotidase
MNLLSWLAAAEGIARQAAQVILQVYATDFAVLGKADASPVTEADERAERLITPALLALAPGVPVVAEEAVSRGEVPVIGTRFWLVDPLDGTKEFVSRNGEFTVNIALIDDGVPVLGVVLQPVGQVLYAGLRDHGAWCQRGLQGPRESIRCRPAPAGGVVVAGSRSHNDEAAMQAWLSGRLVAGRLSAGSSLKFGMVAAGQADMYPRLGRTMEWDTAAGHAVLLAAGGAVNDLLGQPLRYGKPGFENPHFVAQGWP